MVGGIIRGLSGLLLIAALVLFGMDYFSDHNAYKEVKEEMSLKKPEYSKATKPETSDIYISDNVKYLGGAGLLLGIIGFFIPKGEDKTFHH